MAEENPPEHGPAHGAPGDKFAFLTKKYGPLPGWAYVGIVGVPVVFLVLRGGKKAAAGATAATGAPQPGSGYDPGALSYGSTGGGGSGGGGSSTPFDPSGIIAAIKSGNEETLSALQSSNASNASMFTTALGSLSQSLAGISANLNRPTAPAVSSPTVNYTPTPAAPPSPMAYSMPSVPIPAYTPPSQPVYNYNQYSPSTLPIGSYQQTYGGYVPVNPGPLISTNNYNDPRWAGTTVFNGNGQVWHGLVPA